MRWEQLTGFDALYMQNVAQAKIEPLRGRVSRQQTLEGTRGKGHAASSAEVETGGRRTWRARAVYSTATRQEIKLQGNVQAGAQASADATAAAAATTIRKAAASPQTPQPAAKTKRNPAAAFHAGRPRHPAPQRATTRHPSTAAAAPPRPAGPARPSSA
jgi:hypothetical protein